MFDASLFRWLFTHASNERATVRRNEGLVHAAPRAAALESPTACSCGRENCQLQEIMSREG